MANLTLQIHPSIRIDTIDKNYTKSFDGDISIQNAIVEMLKVYPEMSEILIEDREIKPGLLVFADKTELTSMGLLNNILDENLTIRIVPILHGG